MLISTDAINSSLVSINTLKLFSNEFLNHSRKRGASKRWNGQKNMFVLVLSGFFLLFYR